MVEARAITDLTPEELAETERVEAELDAFVTKRAEQAKEQRAKEAAWAENVRRAKEKKRRANGWGWVRHYSRLADSHRALAEENDNKAEHIRGLLGPSHNGHQTKGAE